MKLIINFLFLAISATTFGQSDFVIQVNDSLFDLALDTNYQINIKGGDFYN